MASIKKEYTELFYYYYYYYLLSEVKKGVHYITHEMKFVKYTFRRHYMEVTVDARCGLKCGELSHPRHILTHARLAY